MANNPGALVLNPSNQKNRGDEWTEEYIFEKVNRQTRTIIEDREGNLWLGTRSPGVVKIIFPDKGNIRDYEVKTYDTSHGLPRGEIQVCWAAGHVLFGTKEKLLRFDEEGNRFIPDMTLGKEFSSRLIDVYRLEEEDQHAVPIIAFKDRNLRFYFAAPFFQDETRLTYSFILAGYETRWTDEVKEIFKEYTNLDAGIYTFRDIIPFLKGVLASFEHPLEENELTLDFHTPEESIQLYFDREKLEEVFTNLLANAVKFTPPPGKITVSLKKVVDKEEDFPAGFLEVIIQDTGIGIPREQLAHIFDRFFQVESHERKHKGSGLGLALTRELVVLHHGKIDVNSRVGENSGTEFILRVPLGKNHLKPQEIITAAKEPGPPRPEPEILQETGDNQVNIREEELEDVPIETGEVESAVKKGQEEQSGIKPTILVVEDNPGMRQFIRESIEAYYTVVEAEDGEDGRRKAQELMPDLVISDIMMPKMDGYELCQNLKTQFKTSHIPVILLTAKASESSKVHGLETGADDYIIKPFNMKILVTRIKNLIDLRVQLQEKFQRQMLMQPVEIEVSSIDQKFLQQLQKIIEKHISDEDLNVESLSEKMDISRVTLNKKIQALTGETAVEFIRFYRLKRAMQLLKENFGTVLDVALEVGFSNPSYFAGCFKEKFHQLPSDIQP